jgi:hypothetical protein
MAGVHGMYSSKYAGTVEGPEDWSEEHDHYLYGVPKRKIG